MENLIKFQGDAKKTWCIMTELIGKVKIKKSSLPFKIVPDIALISLQIISLQLAKKIPQSSQPFESYVKNVNSEIENKALPNNELKDVCFS